MIRVLVTGGSAVALIFFVAFVASRLMRARSQGTSIRMQFFLALASIVGAFSLGLGLLAVLDGLEARTTLITEGAAGEEAGAIAALVPARSTPAASASRRSGARPPPRARAIGRPSAGSRSSIPRASRCSRAGCR